LAVWRSSRLKTRDTPAATEKQEAHLRGVVEAALHQRSGLGEAALHLVGQRKGSQEVAACRAGVLRGGQHGPDIAAWVAGLARGQEEVHKIEVAHQSGVVEDGAVERGVSTADERTLRRPAERVALPTDRSHGVFLQSADSAAERIQYPDFDLFAGLLGEHVVGCAPGERG